MNIPTINVDLTDEELVKLSLVNQNYYAQLVKRYEAKLFRYVRRLTNSSEAEVEDLLQEIFLKTFLNLNSFDTSLKFSSWIYRIAHNQVISSWRRVKNRPLQYDIYDNNNNFINQLAADIDIAGDLDKEYLRESISSALAKLDPKYREVLLLKYFEEKSYQEISDIIKKPPGTVATLLNRAKKQLAKILIK